MPGPTSRAARKRSSPRARLMTASHRDGGGILALRIHVLKKPIIAAINGASVGMGATTTLPMDVRLASGSARFGFVFTRRGIIPEGCSSWFLPRVVGIATRERVDAHWPSDRRGRKHLRPASCARCTNPTRSLPAAHELAGGEISEHAAPVSAAMTRQLLQRMLATDDPYVAHRAESCGLAIRSCSNDARGRSRIVPGETGTTVHRSGQL